MNNTTHPSLGKIIALLKKISLHTHIPFKKMNRSVTIFISFLFLLMSLCAFAQQVSENIRLNQIGFYPSSPKVAIITDAENFSSFKIVNAANPSEVVFTGTLKKAGVWEHSGEHASKADFTKLSKQGTYMLVVDGLGTSYPFEIKPNVHLAAGKAALKFYYYQRASTELPEKYAGKYARPAGHPDNEALIHASAATAKRPEGTIINSSKGWYDAGDYNKYIVNSGISTYTLMALYEHYPKFFDTLKLNIPESDNKIPDLLDEILWNLRWMLTMQDEDGGVYHKLTNANFDGMDVMPHAATNKRWIVMKSTCATLDFAATMAQASRVYKKFNKTFADSCLRAAINAYAWARKNPSVLYNQPLMNSKFNPDIQTGAYDDGDPSDEFQWAAIELFASTGKTSYFEEANIELTLRNAFRLPDWSKVNTLGLYTLAHLRTNFPEQAQTMELVKEKIISMAAELRDHQKNTSAFSIAMGVDKGNFCWGSNSVAANQGMLLIQAYNITLDKTFLEAALSNLDYLLGRNGTNYCYLTGFGKKSPIDPHHRPSEGDAIPEPVPGMLVGGPNPGQEDAGNCGGRYTSKLPAKSYIDHDCSYASNEVAINWNAPFAYLTLAIEAIIGSKK